MAVEQTSPDQTPAKPTPERYSRGQTIPLYLGSEDAKVAVAEAKWVAEGTCGIASDRRVMIEGDGETPDDVYDLVVSATVQGGKTTFELSIFGTTINEKDRLLKDVDDVEEGVEEVNRDRRGTIFARDRNDIGRIFGSYTFCRENGTETGSPGISLPLTAAELEKVELLFDIH